MDQALIAHIAQLTNQLTALQQSATLQTNNTTLTTRIGFLEAEDTTLTNANTNLTAQVNTLINASGGGAAVGAAGGGAGVVAAKISFAATHAMVKHQDIIDNTTKVGTMIYDKGCEKLISEFDMKSNGPVVYITKLKAKCIKIGWHVGTQQIINFTNTAGSTINVIYQYGQIDAVMLQTQCKAYCKSF
jgi:hypothetical protein